MPQDVIIVGGSFAGVAAALQLSRARRRVLLIDAGQPRNRFAAHTHGLIGHDGKTPRQLMQEAWDQLRAYPTLEIVEGEAVYARPTEEGFQIGLAGGREAFSRKLILATGVRDELPPVPGLEERWGKTVLHCPYCHGYEFGDRKLGVLANHSLAVEQAVMIPDWGPTTLFTQGVFEPEKKEIARLEARGVTIERTPVAELLGPSPAIEAVRLEDGRVIEIDAFFTQSKTHMASSLAEQLGCKFEDGPLGDFICLDDTKSTTVDGVYAAGDAASPMHSATLAVAAGLQAAISAHHAMIAESWEKKR